MHSATRKFERVQGFRLSATIGVGLAVLLVSCVHLSFAQKMTQQTFASAEEASHALFLAIQSGNEQAIMQILGCGEELVSSDDQLEDKLDREQFATKYQELHRLVQEPDGTTLLYVGAENWPAVTGVHLRV